MEGLREEEGRRRVIYSALGICFCAYSVGTACLVFILNTIFDSFWANLVAIKFTFERVLAGLSGKT